MHLAVPGRLPGLLLKLELPFRSRKEKKKPQDMPVDIATFTLLQTDVAFPKINLFFLAQTLSCYSTEQKDTLYTNSSSSCHML